MANLINMNNQPTISSYDFLKDFINPCRVEAGKAEMENRKFNKKIEEEFGEGIKAGKKSAQFIVKEMVDIVVQW